MHPILINEYMFEPSYDALKFMIQNCSYIYTNLIHAIEYTVLGKFLLTLWNSVQSLLILWNLFKLAPLAF